VQNSPQIERFIYTPAQENYTTEDMWMSDQCSDYYFVNVKLAGLH